MVDVEPTVERIVSVDRQHPTTPARHVVPVSGPSVARARGVVGGTRQLEGGGADFDQPLLSDVRVGTVCLDRFVVEVQSDGGRGQEGGAVDQIGDGPFETGVGVRRGFDQQQRERSLHERATKFGVEVWRVLEEALGKLPRYMYLYLTVYNVQYVCTVYYCTPRYWYMCT